MTLTKSQSKYLLNIASLLKDKDYIKSIDLVRLLNVSRSSCHNMLEVLSDLGLIDINERKITLSSLGVNTANRYNNYYQRVYDILSNNFDGNINDGIYAFIECLSQEQLDKLCTTIN